MTSVTNKHSTALALPDGTVLPAGVATNVPSWDKVKDNAVVKAWQEKDILEVGDSVSTADEKAELQARLDELEVKYDKRSGVEKLRDLLAEAEKAPGENEG